MSDASDNALRAFGMSGMLITDDLRAIESRLRLDLGHARGPTTLNPVDQYPQFEQAVRAEAIAMSSHYEVFYCLEQSIPKLDSQTLHDSVGADWWKSGRSSQDRRGRREPNPARTG